MTFPRVPAPIYTPAYRALQRKALETALSSTPGYREWREHDPGQSASLDQRYAALPVLTKDDLRLHGPEQFVPDGRHVARALAAGEIEYVATSGSTSDAVTNIWFQEWWDSSEAASWKLNAVTAAANLGNHHEAILSSPRCVGFASEDRYLTTEQRTLWNYLFLTEKADPSEWTDALCERMIEELGRFDPVVLEANPSYLSVLCRSAHRLGCQVHQPRLIALTYENASLIHLRHIRSVFGCPVISSYGATECGYVFMQCEAGRFHQNVEHCHVDFQPLKLEHGGPMVGRILVTTFHNPWRSLLRFDCGDLVRLSASPCPCGRNQGYTLDAIEGRIVNATLSCRGRLITQREVDAAIAGVAGVEQYRLIQSASTAVGVDYVSDLRDPAAIEPELTAALRTCYGAGTVIVPHRVASISPVLSTKYRLSRAEFPIEFTEYLAAREVPAAVPPIPAAA